MANKISFLVIVAVIGCASLNAQSVSNSTTVAPFRNESFYSSPIPSGAVRFVYTNMSDTPKCILASDFSHHPSRPLFRVVEEKSGRLSNYVGPLEDRPIFFVEPAYVIVRPKQTVEATIRVQGNYILTTGQRYRIRYSLPVTECEALLLESILVPNASVAFDPPSKASLESWADRLSFVERLYERWAEVGEFIEFNETLHIPEGQ